MLVNFMKNIPMYEKITGLKRPLTMYDFVSIARPLEVNNFPEVDVKFMTGVIYLAELGVYSVVTWDLNKNKPALLLLGHTLFAAIKRWRAEAMQDIIGQTFTVTAKSSNEVVYHDLYCRGRLPLLKDDVIDEVDEYINNLFNIESLEINE